MIKEKIPFPGGSGHDAFLRDKNSVEKNCKSAVAKNPLLEGTQVPAAEKAGVHETPQQV